MQLLWLQCETYGQMFTEALRQYNIICLGMFRKIDVYSSKPTNRVVITNPPQDMLLHISDKVSLYWFLTNQIALQSSRDT